MLHAKAKNESHFAQTQAQTQAQAQAQAQSQTPTTQTRPLITVLGGAVLDITTQLHSEASHSLHTTAPGTVHASLGGVGRNMAEAAQRMLNTIGLAAYPSRVKFQDAVRFVGPVAQDSMAALLKTLWQVETPELRLDGLVSLPSHTGQGTPTCSLMLQGNGDLERGVIQASLVESLDARQIELDLSRADDKEPMAVVLDANLSIDTLCRALTLNGQTGYLTLVEPTSRTKAVKASEALLGPHLTGEKAANAIVTPNLLELRSMAAHALERVPQTFMDSYQMVKAVQSDDLLGSLLPDQEGPMRTLPQLLALTELVGPVGLTLGGQGVLLALPPQITAVLHPHKEDGAGTTWRMAGFGPQGFKEWELIHVPPPLPVGKVVSTTGAGDTFAGALVALLRASQNLDSTPGRNVWEHVRAPRSILALAQAAAIQTLSSSRAVGELGALASLPELQPAWKAFFEQGGIR